MRIDALPLMAMWPRVSSSVALLFSSLLHAACGASPDELGQATAGLEVVPVLHFEADGTITASGPLVAGGRVRIDYASERAICRGETRGRPYWSATGHYRVNDGPEGSFEAGGIVNDHRPDAQVISLPEAGELAIWFENGNGWGCHATDPASGRYRFSIEPGPGTEGWVGNAVSIITRASCEGRCSEFARPLSEGFRYDDWAWSRAVTHAVKFEVWVPGLTDRDHAGLWRDLDVRVYTRFGQVGAFRPTPVLIEGRSGNNVRYALDLTAFDPFRLHGQPYRRGIETPEDCPPVPFRETADGRGLEVSLELYFTVNGVPVRPEGDETFRGTYSTTMYVPGTCVRGS